MAAGGGACLMRRNDVHMLSNFKCVLAVFGGGGVMLISVVTMRADEKEWTRQPPDFRQVKMLESTRQAAAAARIPLEGLLLPVDRAGVRPGDWVTALVTWSEDEKLKQWIVSLEAVEPSEKEKKTKVQTSRFFTSSGYEFRFGSERAALEIKLVGPLEEKDAGRKTATTPEVKRRRITVGADYLALGLDRVPATTVRVRAAKAANPNLPAGNLQIGGRAFPPEIVGPSRAAADAVGITEADERAMAGSLLALIEFLQITMQTPGLQDVLKSVLDVPWWSIVSSGGKMPGVYFVGLKSDREVNPRLWNLRRPTKVFAIPYLLKLNNEPALLFQLAVTTPQPPLIVSAGIVGLAAGRPDGKGPVLTLQVMASGVAAGR